jgi:hypothetical protein
LFATPWRLDLKTNVFDYFHIQGLLIFASTLSDFRQSSQFGGLISHSMDADALTRLTYLRWHAALLPLTFIALRFLDSITSNGRFQCVIHWKAFERPSF